MLNKDDSVPLFKLSHFCVIK